VADGTGGADAGAVGATAMLLAAGADVTAVDDMAGGTPLHYAAALCDALLCAALVAAASNAAALGAFG